MIVIIALVHVLAHSVPKVEVIPEGEEDAQEANRPKDVCLEELFLDFGPLIVLFSLIDVHSELA